ncbi:MAG TPA: hypothetical protein VFY65_12860 [Longimicrobium sp.]|nr:hypothetical protein [Longimicrobium sp.]
MLAAPAGLVAQQRDTGAVERPRTNTTRPPRPVPPGSASAQRPATRQRFSRWLGRFLGLSPDVFGGLTAVRGDAAGAVAGERLMRVSLDTGQETEIWRCAGCWSPAPAADDGLAVLRADGIWVLTPGRAPRLAVAAQRLERIVARIDPTGMRLLVARRKDSGPVDHCPLDLVVAELSTGRISSLEDAEVQCLGFREVFTADRQRGSRVAAETSARDALGRPLPRRLKWADTPNGEFHPLPPPGGEGESLEAYDPVWTGEDVLVFVARRWPADARP